MPQSHADGPRRPGCQRGKLHSFVRWFLAARHGDPSGRQGRKPASLTKEISALRNIGYREQPFWSINLKVGKAQEQELNGKTNLRHWLARYGFERYDPILAENDIDSSVVADLTEDDLKELGFSLGDRKRFFRAVEADAPDAETDPPDPSTSEHSSLHGDAERRQATFGFCDLAGSTRLATQHDAEDMGLILQSYHACCRDIIESWGGQILSLQGDGVFFGFGFRTAHEDDPERAIRAALEIRDTVSDLEILPNVELRIRIGIATGRVVVGNVIGATHSDGSVAGAVASIPLRLQELAAPNTVVIADTTRRLLRNAFDLRHIGVMDLDGQTDKVGVWQVDGALAIGRAAAEGRAAVLVGRTKELSFLTSRWQRAKDGQGQTVLLSSEPGMGKSQIIRKFAQGIPSAEAIQINLFSANYHSNTTLFPVVSYIERIADISGRESRADRREKLLTPLAPLTQIDSAAVDILAPLLGVEQEDETSEQFSGAQRKVLTLNLLSDHLVAQASDKPLLVVLEDAHWCDPTTMELFTKLISESINAHRIMLLISHRPDFQPPWPRSATLTPLRFEALGPDDSADLIRALPASADLDAGLIAQIVERADGVPLYLEELAKAVAEAGIEQEHDAAHKAHVSVPVSLADSLMARLDRLKSGKTVAQIASAIGRRFTTEMLGFVIDLPPEHVNRGLNELVGAELLTRRGVGSDATYTFQHALVQEVAYSSLLKSEIAVLHQKIATVLQEFFHELTESEPELVALHYARANMPNEAIRFLIGAGVRALTQAAYVEARNHFHEVIALVALLPQSPERDRQDVELRIFLGGALIAAMGYAAEDVYATFLAAYQKCADLDEPALMTSVLYGLWVVHLARSDRAKTISLSQELLTHAGTRQNPAEWIAAHFSDGITRFYRGDLVTAEDCFGKVFDDYETSLNPRLVQGFSDDLGQFAYVQSAWLATLRDDETTAMRHETRAFEDADQLNDVMSEARASVFAMLCRHDRGDVSETRAFANRAIGIATERVVPFWLALGRCGLGWSLARDGSAAEGVEEITQGLAFFDLIQQKLPLTYWRSYLVEAHLLAGDPDKALQLVDDTLLLSDKNVDSVFAPELLRLKARAVLLGSGDRAEVKALLQTAAEQATRQGTRLYVNHIARDLADLG